MSALLMQLVDHLNAGTLRVVDLTQPLGPATPVIGLPPIFASSPGVTIDVISKYDDRGPAWYWNTLTFGEHTGTHFDAPVHWITGRDLAENACDTIPARRFIGPACVIDATADVAANADFLVTPARIEAWEGEHGRIPPGAWVLLRTGWSLRTGAEAFLNVAADGSYSGRYGVTDGSGAYVIDSLAVGCYTVGFYPLGMESPTTIWYAGASIEEDATPVCVTAGATSSSIDAVVPASIPGDSIPIDSEPFVAEIEMPAELVRSIVVW